MNKFRSILMTFLILSGIYFLTGCVKGDFDTPTPPKADSAANISISQLLAMHTAGTVTDITTDVIVKGVVVANDETGNLYKQIYIEDDSAGLQIQLDAKSLYTSYKVGQLVYIKCKGLALGEYGGNVQLGYNVEGVINRIPAAIISSHLLLDGWPGEAPASKLITIPTLSASRLNMLVKLEGIHFADAGQPFSLSTATTNRNMLDASSNILVLRTSNYATFASSLIPSGTGTVTGILSIYNAGYQFYIRDLNDLQGFSK
jgi:hypothetical protein